jgi:hypothetical protein
LAWIPQISLRGALISVTIVSILLGVNMNSKKAVVDYGTRQPCFVLDYEYGWPVTMLRNSRPLLADKDARCLDEIWRRFPLGGWTSLDLSQCGEFADVNFDGKWSWSGVTINLVTALLISLLGAFIAERIGLLTRMWTLCSGSSVL